MAISGVGQSYYQNNVATTKSTKSVNSTEETGNTKELSEAEEMAIFKCFIGLLTGNISF